MKKRRACAHLEDRHFRVKLCSTAFPYNHLGRLGLMNVVFQWTSGYSFPDFPACCAKFSSMERTMEHLGFRASFDSVRDKVQTSVVSVEFESRWCDRCLSTHRWERSSLQLDDVRHSHFSYFQA